MKYELKDGNGWIRATKATTNGMKPGWLHYELKEKDGSITTGLAGSDKWRIIVPGSGWSVKKETA